MVNCSHGVVILVVMVVVMGAFIMEVMEVVLKVVMIVVMEVVMNPDGGLRQGGITCEAIDEPKKSSKAIDKRVIIDFCDKNVACQKRY